MILRHAFARYRGDHDPDMTELLRPLKLDNGQGRVVVGDHRDPLEAVGMGTAKLREPVIIGAQQRPFELGVIDAEKAQPEGGVQHLSPDCITVDLGDPGVGVIGGRRNVLFPTTRLTHLRVAPEHTGRGPDWRHLDVLADELVTVFAVNQARRTITVLLRKTRSEEHTSELQSLMRISYAVFCLKKKNNTKN